MILAGRLNENEIVAETIECVEPGPLSEELFKSPATKPAIEAAAGRVNNSGCRRHETS